MKQVWRGLMRKYLHLLVIILIFLTGCLKDNNQYVTKFVPIGVPQGNETKYELDLKMDSEGLFKINAKINIKNTSQEEWNSLVFYFIPNMFTNKNSANVTSTSTVDIKSVNVNNRNINYSLKEDNLSISLREKLKPNDTVKVNISYSLTLPEEGFRFTKYGSNYHLAQWYPMVPTYRNGWNKEIYQFKGESYHTPFSDFELTYEVPSGYTVVTSSGDDPFPSENHKKISINKAKELFVAILKKPLMEEYVSGDLSIRIFSSNKNKEQVKNILKIAREATKYFEENIGDYPHNQLDIVIEGVGMEYPGIITIGAIEGSHPLGLKQLEQMVVHEIAHQWFYGVVSNDPFHDPWIDEGITNMATSIFLYRDKTPADLQKMRDTFSKYPLPVDLSLNEYGKRYNTYVYGKASAMLESTLIDIKGEDGPIKFLSTYYSLYSYKEVNTKEILRFMKYYLKLKDNSAFDKWVSNKYLNYK